MAKMENCSLRFSPIGQLFLEGVSDEKSIFLQTEGPLVTRAEVTCPKPCRATGVPYLLDSVSRFGSKAGGNHGLGFLDVILTKDELEGDSDATNQIGVLCGSPPVRTNNPVVRDAEFAKLGLLSASPLGNSHGMKPPKHDKGSPSCGSPLGASPKVRIEGFACGSPESRRVVSALA